MKEQMDGALHDVGGKIQEAVGAAADNPGLAERMPIREVEQIRASK